MSKPVIFIPGFPASELHDRSDGHLVYPPSFTTLLDPVKKQRFLDEVTAVPGNLVAGPPIAAVLGGVVSEAQSIYNILRDQYGYDISGTSLEFVPVGWDWRQSIACDDTVQRIAGSLDRLSPAKDGKVVAILHSTGGLVFRAFLEKRPEYRSCFEQVLAFGIPWNGTLEALHAIALGDSQRFLFINLISAPESAWMLSHAQAAYELLPIEFRNDLSWIPADAEHDFMRALAASAHPPFSRVFDVLPVTNVCGWGAATWPACTLVGGKLTFLPREKDAGDGTVALVSSSWLGGAKVRSMSLPIGAYATGFLPKVHGQLWDSPPVLQIFDEVLANAARQPFIAAAADSDQYIDYASDVTVRVAALASDGSPLPNCVAKAGSTTVPFNGETRAEIIIKRAGIHHNIEPDLYRFTIEFQWAGGSAERVVVIRSV